MLRLVWNRLGNALQSISNSGPGAGPYHAASHFEGLDSIGFERVMSCIVVDATQTELIWFPELPSGTTLGTCSRDRASK